MRKLIFNCVVFCFVIVFPSYAQVSKGGRPKSFDNPKLSIAQEIVFPEIDKKSLLQEDQKNEEAGDKPYRFGVPFYVNHTLSNSGTWDILANGDRLWHLTLKSKGAYSINLVFNQYKLPNGAELFLYNADKSMVIGAFTNANHQEDGKFGVQPIKGDEITIEYYEPKTVKNQGVLEISEVVHGYKDLFDEAYGYGNSLPCHTNINCPEGMPWQDQKRAVTLIVAGGNLCSGTMVNNTSMDGTPYLLTADHCFSGSVSTWVYVFNYENPACQNVEGPSHQTVSGATLRARNSDSDFLLIKLNSVPPQSYNVYYAGWSRIATAASSVVGIHHPAGDIKKISLSANPVVSDEWNSSGIFNHWKINGWDNGTTEGGSSGSALFNQDGRIVGQLHGGSSTSCPGTGKTSMYGKFDYSWNSGSTPSDRLVDWLDPLNTGALTLNGANLSNLVSYCTSLSTSAIGSLISDVTFGTIANSSGISCATYSDFSSLSTDVLPGNSIPLSVTTGTCGLNETRFIKVFIDWNADFDFNDQDELVATSNAITSASPFTTIINVPTNVVAGNYARMRIVCEETLTPSAISACGSYTTGETEDYTINIISGPSYTLPITGSTSITACSGVLYDNGGLSGNYSNSCSGSTTIYPLIAGNKVSLTFTSFSTESCCDYFYLYDGINISAPLIGIYTSNPGTVYATNAAGALTVLLVSDNSVDYSGFQANITCVSSLPGGDLIIQSPIVTPSTVSPGSVITTSCNINNQGVTPSLSSNVGYYLSTDNIWDASDIYLDSSSGGIIAGSSLLNRTASLIIPTTISLGTYYILFYADYSDEVLEPNETNNIVSSEIYIVPPVVDFIVQTPIVYPTSIYPGGEINVSSYISNNGTTSAATSNVGYYLSTDNIWDASDIYLSYSPGSLLSSNTNSYRLGKFVIPDSILPGSYNIIFFADHSLLVSEVNELNNKIHQTITIVKGYGIPTSGSINVSACDGSVFDIGGQANYTNSSNGKITIYPSIAGNFIKLDFLDFSVEGCCDRLLIYNDTTTSASSIIGNYNTTSPGTVYSSNVYGALTLQFISNYINTARGFEAAISCIPTIPKGDLVIQSPSSTAASVAQGRYLSLNSDIYNIGGTQTLPCSLGYYLSTDNVWDVSDIYLSASSVTSLGSGAFANKAEVVAIPGATTPGTYFLLFYADYLNNHAESDETNNASSITITVFESQADFTIKTPLISNSDIAYGGKANLNCYIFNQGMTFAPSVNLGYYLSTDNIWDASDILLTSSSVTNLSPPYSIYQSATITIPNNTPIGYYYVLFYADYDNNVSEIYENNNLVSLAITVIDPFIDFTIWSTTGTTSIPYGGILNTTCSINNDGNVVAPISTIGYYLSIDNSLDPSDIFLGSTSAGILNPDSYNYKGADLTIPASTAIGSYYILYFADYNNIVSENIETNNVYADEITIVAPTSDLVVQSATLSENNLPLGGLLIVTNNVYNQGTSLAPSNDIGYYLSTNITLDATDIYLNNSSLNYIWPSSVQSSTANLTIPFNIAPGGYYILFHADYSNLVAESNEANNVSYQPITINNNFAVPITGTDSISTCGGILYDHGGLGNYSRNATGVLTIYPSIAGNYIRLDFTSFSVSYSSDPLYIYNDTIVSSSSLIGAYYNITPGVIYSTNPSGALTLRFITDYSGFNPGFEASISCVPALPQGDLIIQNPNIPSTVIQGNSILLTSYLKNQGGITSTTSKIGYYLSTDNVWDVSDIYLAASVDLIAKSGEQKYDYQFLPIPLTTAPGAYYILIYADYQNVYPESDETNNISALPISVGQSFADIAIQSPTMGKTTIPLGGSTYFSSYIYNFGTTVCPVSSLGFYLSIDNILDASDIFLNSTSITSIDPSYSTWRSVTITMPVTAVVGSYYIIASGDDLNEVIETNETNNVASIAITLATPAIDLIIQSTNSTPLSVPYGETITASCQILNQGNFPTSSSNVGYYLSTDNSWDISDLLLGNTTGGYLNSSAQSGRSQTLIIPSIISTGNYFILFHADYSGLVLESNENNNFSSIPITVIHPAVDLIIQNPIASVLNVLSGSYTNAYCYINNIGTTIASSVNVGFYLSTNTSLDASDIKLNQSLGYSLNPGISEYRSASLSIPKTTAAGNYFILYVADYSNAIIETNETNNINHVAITIINPTIDLYLQSPAASPTSIGIGQSTTITCSIRNQGTSESNSANIGYFLSVDNVWDASDIYLAYSLDYGLSAYGQATRSITFSMPSGVSLGNYYVILYADYLNYQTETNETNNISTIPITLNGNWKDLIIQNPILGTQVKNYNGVNINISCNVANLGNTSCASSNLRYYLSSNTIWDISDYLLDDYDVPGINGSSSQAVSNNVFISYNQKGYNYLLLYADYYKNIAETDEINNVLAIPFSQLNETETPTNVSNTISIYPNPNSGQFYVTIENAMNQKCRMTVLNGVGKEISTKESLQSGNKIIEYFVVDEIASGFYTLRIEVGENSYFGKISVVK